MQNPRNLIRVILPSALLLVISATFFMTLFTDQNANASTNEITTLTGETSMNLWIEGIVGESTIPGREESCDIIAYSHSIRNSYNLDTRISEKIIHSPLRVTKWIDKASPKLYEKLCTGQNIISIRLECYLEPSSLIYLKIELTYACVVSIEEYGTIEANNIPTETVSFTYEKIKWTYTAYDPETNKPVGNVEYEATWGNVPS